MAERYRERAAELCGGGGGRKKATKKKGKKSVKCKHGKLKNPVGRRVCKKAPRKKKK
jgi:hypothetical protein